MNEKYHDIDKLFQDTFENNEVAPPYNMWSKIESNLPLSETDKLFKDALEDYEQDPQASVWTKITSDLPLSLTLRNGLVYLSRIAAVLLVGISVYLFFQHFDMSKSESIAQGEHFQQEIDIAFEQEKIDESDVLSDEDILQEPIAMLEETSNNYIDDDFDVSPKNSPFLNPDNVAKGSVRNNNTFENQAAVINVDEIARRMENGDNSRIASKDLFEINFVTDEEERTKIDTSLIEAEKGKLKDLRNKRMYDVYATIDLDGKIRYPQSNTVADEAPGLNNIPVAMSLQGEEAIDFDYNGNRAKGVVIEKKPSKFKSFITKCKKAISKITD